MYWKDKKIYKKILSMNGEGNISSIKSIIKNPALTDYFTFFIQHKQYDLLEEMLIEHGTDLVDIDGRNLAFLSGFNKSYKLLNLAEKFNSSPFKKDNFQVNALMNSCYSNINYRFFYFYWKHFKNEKLKILIEKDMTKILLQEKIIDISFSVSRILTSDDNLLKLKYIYKNLPLDIQKEVRSLWCSIAYHNNSIQLTEYLSDERYLMIKLNNCLPHKLIKKSKKI